MRLLGAPVVVTWFLATTTSGVELVQQPRGHDPLVLSGGTLIDGTGRRPLPRSVVVLRGGRIEAVGQLGRVAVPAQARTVDLTGRFLIPGLIDSHASALLPCEDQLPDCGRSPSEQRMREWLSHGVTTIRNLAGPAGLALALRRDQERGSLAGPRLYTGGRPLGMHDAKAVEQAIRVQARAGVDLLHLGPEMPPGATRAAIEAAHSRGLPVLGELQRTPWDRAARYRIDAVAGLACWSEAYLAPVRRERYRRARSLGSLSEARLVWLDLFDASLPEVGVMIRWLKRRRVWVTTGLAALEAQLGDDARARALWPKVEALVRLYQAKGVRLTAGSGTSGPELQAGLSLHRELELLVAAGLDPVEALGIATRQGAAALRASEDLGTIVPGQQADLLVLTADPLGDIRNTRSIELIIQAGTLITPQSLQPAPEPEFEPDPASDPESRHTQDSTT